jgi:hypothetical protein
MHTFSTVEPDVGGFVAIIFPPSVTLISAPRTTDLAPVWGVESLGLSPGT